MADLRERLHAAVDKFLSDYAEGDLFLIVRGRDSATGDVDMMVEAEGLQPGTIALRIIRDLSSTIADITDDILTGTNDLDDTTTDTDLEYS